MKWSDAHMEAWLLGKHKYPKGYNPNKCHPKSLAPKEIKSTQREEET